MCSLGVIKEVDMYGSTKGESIALYEHRHVESEVERDQSTFPRRR